MHIYVWPTNPAVLYWFRLDLAHNQNTEDVFPGLIRWWSHGKISFQSAMNHSGDRLNVKMLSYRYKDSHNKDETV